MDLQHLRASDGTGEAVLAHVDAPRIIGSTVLSLDNVDNWNSKCIVVTGTPNANGYIAAAGMTIMYGHITAGDFIIDGYAPGYSDVGNTTNDIAIVKMTTNWADALIDLLDNEHKDNGKHKDVTADSVILNSGQDLSNEFLYSQGIINGGCMIAQRATVPSISSTYQYGKVDRFAAKATGTAVSAGTITQNTSSLVAATKGYEIKLAGVTLTGSGIVYLRYRMEAKDALMFKNARASFGVRIHQDTGVSVNATIYVRKANAADNFAAVTDIANSGAIAVPNNTATDVKFQNINSGSLGDCSNGLEIEIQVAVGAITTKNISFAELRLNLGATTAPFQPRRYDDELDTCLRYYQEFTEPHHTGQVNASGTGVSRMGWHLAKEMRVAPTMTISAIVPVFDGGVNTISSVSVSYMGKNRVQYDGNLTGALTANRHCVAYAGGATTPVYRLDAEL